MRQYLVVTYWPIASLLAPNASHAHRSGQTRRSSWLLRRTSQALVAAITALSPNWQFITGRVANEKIARTQARVPNIHRTTYLKRCIPPMCLHRRTKKVRSHTYIPTSRCQVYSWNGVHRSSRHLDLSVCMPLDATAHRERMICDLEDGG